MLIEVQNQSKLLASKNEQLESFIRIASHDLREPLATIKNMTILLMEYQNKPMDNDFTECASFIISCTERMDKLTLGILEYAVAGKNSTLSQVNLSELIQTIIWDLKASIDRTDASIHFENLPVLLAYEMEIKQLFQNLISNAIKYRKENVSPVVNIHCKETPGHFRFEVADNGIGIAPEDQEKVFRMFGRLEKKKSEAGLGIGLAITKKIIDLHKGEIWIENNLFGGTTFVFTIRRFPA